MRLRASSGGPLSRSLPLPLASGRWRSLAALLRTRSGAGRIAFISQAEEDAEITRLELLARAGVERRDGCR